MNLKDLPEAMRRQAIEQYPDMGAQAKTVSPSKYRNARAEYAGMMFASGHEASVIAGLIKADEEHRIWGLRLQVAFPLPGCVYYRADAVYLELRDGKLELVVCDAKGFDVKSGTYRLTSDFKLKRKLFRERYGTDITIL